MRTSTCYCVWISPKESGARNRVNQTFYGLVSNGCTNSRGAADPGDAILPAANSQRVTPKPGLPDLRPAHAYIAFIIRFACLNSFPMPSGVAAKCAYTFS
jgi:hypothetical protein